VPAQACGANRLAGGVRRLRWTPTLASRTRLHDYLPTDSAKGDDPALNGKEALGTGYTALRSLLALLPALPSGAIAPSPCLPRPRHARRQVIPRAVLALLGLDGLVVHVHVVLGGNACHTESSDLSVGKKTLRKKIRDKERIFTMEKQNELTQQPLLLTVPQVAKELSLSRTMVYILINREGLPVVRSGRAVRISAPSLQKWVEERERASMSAASSWDRDL
jgi:excisionase family DNA binding protein